MVIDRRFFLLGRDTKKPSRVPEMFCILISLVVTWVYTYVKIRANKISALCSTLYSKGQKGPATEFCKHVLPHCPET